MQIERDLRQCFPEMIDLQERRVVNEEEKAMQELTDLLPVLGPGIVRVPSAI